MSSFALSVVLVAACLHALWNALLKGHRARLTAFAAVASGQAVVGAVAAPMLPLPDPASWPALAASTLIHWGYMVFLHRAYRHGDLSLAYPVSRGIAPLLVAAGSYLAVGETLPTAVLSGLAAISVGILMLSMGEAAASRRTTVAALATGICIACYSIVDGIGVRLAGVPWSYVAWLFLLEAPGPVLLWLWFGGRFELRTMAINCAGGILSAIAYGLVLFAKTIAPIGAVSAARESSVAIASLIGIVWFGERPWRLRVASALVVVAGLVLLALGG